MYVLRREQFFEKNIEDVFRFFQQPENLERITPADLKFTILTPKPIEMKEGALIDYTIKICGVPVRWRTKITGYNPPHSFSDSQLRGPYAVWEHSHRFESVNGGTLMTDEVHYRIPLGPLGRLAHFLFVRRQLNHIFDYRRRIIEEIMQKW